MNKYIIIFLSLTLPYIALGIGNMDYHNYQENHPKNLFSEYNIIDTVTLSGKKYYKLNFQTDLYNNMYKTKATFDRFIKQPLENIYGVDIYTKNRDSLLFIVNNPHHISISDTLNFKHIINGKYNYIYDISLVSNGIYIPFIDGKEVKYKKQYEDFLRKTHIINNIFDNKEIYKNEINGIVFSDRLKANKFLRNKAVELCDGLRIEEKVLTIATYCATIIDYDTTLKTKGFESVNAHNILTNGVGVCEAFSTLFTIMLDTLNDDKFYHGYIVSKWHESNITHKSNMISINGNVYWFDITRFNSYINNKTMFSVNSNDNIINTEFIFSRKMIYDKVLYSYYSNNDSLNEMGTYKVMDIMKNKQYEVR